MEEEATGGQQQPAGDQELPARVPGAGERDGQHPEHRGEDGQRGGREHPVRVPGREGERVEQGADEEPAVEAVAQRDGFERHGPVTRQAEPAVGGEEQGEREERVEAAGGDGGAVEGGGHGGQARNGMCVRDDR
ncbi:hypothetical protein [Amycolatopsis mediterranei]|uniref:Uncharacterized protein n=1 Tax=Amycolatopsis mediterranei (strain S699) TaxID=713604 RepID=A0A9R0UC54_AMYMS|nr:hypothetical protein [Amycolatopsis mediterranei]AEK45569.1 hypothetical protein RAM_35480 [Amycolatopsis mediterranei S699]KDO03851.1 hypothetical protein DV26_45020 [Amycolatopsis mediterranei]KDU94259.1 hypothetical protein DV36_02625 [Amycolatopsis mediterranei]UZF73628.1 hypothetical protein ISP_007082 [Amycolatopsis mediterranei]